MERNNFIFTIKFLIIKNPFFVYIKNLCKNIILMMRNPTLRLYGNTKCTDVSFGIYNTIYPLCSLNHVCVDDFSYIAHNTHIHQTKIGKFCSIGPNCQIGVGMHPTSVFVSTHPSFYSTLCQCGFSYAQENLYKEFLPIEIKNDVWIGANCIILDGVKIGNGCIIGANSIVTKDVPDYAIVAGSPARIIRYRFTEETIQDLLSIQWWNWDIKILKKKSIFFNNITSFLESFRHPKEDNDKD